MEKRAGTGGLFAAAAIFAAAILAALARPPDAGPWVWFFILWLVLFAVTLLAFDSEADSRRITGFIKRRDNALVYSAATAFILKHLARMMAPTTVQRDPCPGTGFIRNIDWYMTPRAMDSADTVIVSPSVTFTTLPVRTCFDGTAQARVGSRGSRTGWSQRMG